MDWVNLLQDGAIVCLAVALIVDSFSIRGLRKQIDVLGKSKQDKGDGTAKNLALIDKYVQSYSGDCRLTYDGHRFFTGFTPHPFEECTSAPGLKPRLFRQGDSVRIRGLKGEFVLTGYSSDGFSARKKTGLPSMDKDMTVDVSTTVTFHADRVTAWKRNTGEWPVEWFMGTGSKRKEGGQDDHARRVKDRNKKNAAAGTCGSDKRK